MGSISFWNEFTCLLCAKYFIDPVTLICQHSFCMPCLYLCWEEAKHPPRCPVCREPSHHVNLKTNIVLKTRVFLARRRGPYDLLSCAEEICEIHMKTKNFFCEVTKNVLCLPCCKSEEHGAHRHCSIEWMRSLNLGGSLPERECKRKNMIRPEYWKVCPFVYHEEKHYLGKIEEESDEIFQQLKGTQHNMYLKGKLLSQIYEELRELCHKPDMELLQVRTEDWRFMVESAQLHMPQPVVPQLSSWPIPGLVDWLNQFQVYIALDNEIVTGHVPVFEDLRRLLAGPDHPGVDNTPPRSKYLLAWGAVSFTSGQHYWEVDVAGCCSWAIGFCNDSWARKNDMVLDSEGIFLLLCIKENNQCSLFTSSPLSPQYVKRPLGRVGLLLDYDGGFLSFFNVANSSLICRFLSCSFSSPLRPFLCSGHP
uniref:Tripartite motif-containing protein 77-like n=1 Tax=Balaenoptera musculus TaxID=9771 RepID=A0A8C0CL06_BALMU